VSETSIPISVLNFRTRQGDEGESLSDDRNFEWAVATGERAFAYLKQLQTPPVPRNYELFFTYAAGYDNELNDAIRDAVFAHASLPEDEVERLLTAHFPQHRLNQKVGEVGAQVAAELNQVIDTIHTASRSSEDFGHSLEQMAEELERIATPAQLKGVVDSLHKVTQQMAENSRTLAKRAVTSKTLIQGLHHVLEMVRADSLTDGLTGVANRRRFDQVLEIETAEAAKSGDPLCLALADVDHFKRFNDTFGHQTGDQVLRVVAQTLKTNIKGGDHLSRYGGEEFALLLPRTALADAVKLADKLRGIIKARELVQISSELSKLTLSVGIAVYQPGESLQAFVQRADRCLYAAKQAGRDRVEPETSPAAISAASTA